MGFTRTASWAYLRVVERSLILYLCCTSGASDGSILRVQVQDSEIFKDDLTGQLLPPDLVRAARETELEYFDGRVVWENDL